MLLSLSEIVYSGLFSFSENTDTANLLIKVFSLFCRSSSALSASVLSKLGIQLLCSFFVKSCRTYRSTLSLCPGCPIPNRTLQ